MGWETNVLENIVFNKETYNSLYEVDSAIDENTQALENLKQELSIMAMSRPEDMLIHNENMNLLGLHREVIDKLNLIEEYIIDIYKLQILRDNFNLRDGDFIDNKNRKNNIKKWLIDNYILEKDDFK